MVRKSYLLRKSLSEPNIILQNEFFIFFTDISSCGSHLSLCIRNESINFRLEDSFNLSFIFDINFLLFDVIVSSVKVINLITESLPEIHFIFIRYVIYKSLCVCERLRISDSFMYFIYDFFHSIELLFDKYKGISH